MGREIGSSLKQGEILALVGDLGAGKTVFVQGVAHGLGIKNRIVSPTFILMRKYNNFYHVDLYRLEGDVEKEVENLGLLDILKDKNNIVAIEWAEKIKDLLPGNTTLIHFENLGEDERKIIIENG